MKKIGKITKTPEGKFQLQYWFRENELHGIKETSSVWKIFDTLQDAMVFVKTTRVSLEKKEDFGKTVSFPCPNCQKRGINSLADKEKSGGFFCSRCDSTYFSYESARTIFEE